MLLTSALASVGMNAFTWAGVRKPEDKAKRAALALFPPLPIKYNALGLA
jgi:hypothetical protein